MLALDLKKVELARAKQCFTKQDLAKQAGICYSTLMKLLHGHIKLTAKTLGKLAKALNVEPEDLIQD